MSKARIASKMIPLNKLFIDEIDEEIYVRNVRKAHGKEGSGYQRDPYERIKWIKARVENYTEPLMRPMEVSPRQNGMFAVVDGGGRFLLAELVGLKEVECRIHEGLAREDEAELFEALDSETYKLRAIEKFMASLAAANPIAVEVNESVAPYKIAKRGKGTLQCVNPLMAIYKAAGVRLISRTSKILANTWSGYLGAGQWSNAKKIEGKQMLAVAILIDVAGSHFDEAQLRKVLMRFGPKDLDKTVEGESGSSTLGTATYVRAAAKVLARKYNRPFENESAKRVLATDIDNSVVVEAILEGHTYSRMVREASKKTKMTKAA